MKRFLAILLLLAIPTAFPSAPAYACSFSFAKGHSPNEIKHSTKNINIKGTYKLEKIVGKDAFGKEIVYYGSGPWPGVMYNAYALGTITSDSGKTWKTINDVMPDDSGIECIDFIRDLFPVPSADAEGIFWIESKTSRGRHKILIWEGDYLPRPDATEKKD